MNLSEKELIDGLTQGDKQVFDLIFRNHYPGLCTYACSYVKSAEIAEEIVQELFIRIWEKHPTLHIHTSIKAYLYQSVFNASVNHLKKLQSKGYSHIDVESQTVRNELLSMDMADDKFSKLYSDDAERDLESAIESLPDQCRQIFRMARFSNMSYGEISDRLNVSRSTVKTQMARAMDKIMKQMDKYF
jgi:RNA polymerase sigma-70 factor, ECF subfamily